MNTWQHDLKQSIARHADNPASRFAQLATVGLDSLPQVRTVVVRDVGVETDQLVFFTHLQSDKVAEIAANNQVQLCWYFEHSREQYRLSGTTEHVNDLARCQQYWANMSSANKQQFFWGKPKSPRQQSILTQQDGIPAQTLEQVPESFAVMSLQIDRVDYLALPLSGSDATQTRQIWRQSTKGWHKEDVVP